MNAYFPLPWVVIALSGAAVLGGFVAMLIVYSGGTSKDGFAVGWRIALWGIVVGLGLVGLLSAIKIVSPDAFTLESWKSEGT